MRDSNRGTYALLGRLLEYPDESFPQSLADCRRGLKRTHPDTALQIDSFASGVEGLSLERLQELFTQTFDLSPICSLEVGWQLYGEEYSRGAFLVAMRGLLREHGVQEAVELPDHLTHILPLLDRLESPRRVEFDDQYLKPAMAKMLKAFQGKESPYEHVLQACEDLLPHSQQRRPARVTHE